MSAAEPRPIPQLSLFEAHLVRIARGVLGHFPPDQTIKYAERKMSPPKCLSGDALDVLRDTLRKGVMLYLVRAGAWRNGRSWRGEKSREGRLWGRYGLDEMALTFSEQSYLLLRTLTAAKPAEWKETFSAPATLTPGDEFLLFAAYKTFRHEGESLKGMKALACVRRSALIRMSFPSDFAAADIRADIDWGRWTRPDAVWMLEAFTSVWEQSWLLAERAKGSVINWDDMRLQGEVGRETLAGYLQAIDAAGRRDLGIWITRFLDRLLTPGIDLTFWTANMRGTAPLRLADRLEVQREALGVVRQAETLANWHRQARSAGYLDEDYAASQFFLKQWEAAGGEDVVPRARRVLESLEPLRSTEGDRTGGLILD